MGGAGIRSGGGEGKKAGVIALGNGIILDVGLLPRRVYGGVGVEAKLHNEARDDAEEGGVGKKSVADQIVEAVGAERSPGTGDFHHEIAGGGFKSDFVLIGRSRFQRGRVKQRRIQTARSGVVSGRGLLRCGRGAARLRRDFRTYTRGEKGCEKTKSKTSADALHDFPPILRATASTSCIKRRVLPPRIFWMSAGE